MEDTLSVAGASEKNGGEPHRHGRRLLEVMSTQGAQHYRSQDTDTIPT
jgi:hypothetical protein